MNTSMPSDDPGPVALPMKAPKASMASKFELGRRRFLQAGAGVAGTAGISSLLAACGGGSSKAPSGNSSGGATPGKFDQTIEWGIFLPTSGPFVSVSAPWISGTQAVFDKINEGGGIKVKGKQIGFKVGVYNSQYAAGPALTQFRKFVSNDGHFLSGMIAVEEGVAIQGLNVRNDVLVVQIVAGKTTQLTPNSLRLFTGLDNSVTYTPLADYAKDVIGATKISSIELNNDWGHSIYTAVQKRFTDGGGEWLARQYLQPTDTDFTQPLTTMLQSKPDLLAIIMGDGAGELVVKQARSLGWKGPMLLIGAWDCTAVPGAGAVDLADCYGVAGNASCHQTPEFKAFRQQIYAKTKQVGDFGFSAPDGINAVVSAMEAANSTSPKDVMEALPDAIKKGIGTYQNGWTGAFNTKSHGVYVEAPAYVARMEPTVDPKTTPVWTPVTGAKYLGYPAGTPRSEVPDVIG
ncbi:MAG: hypothetical protein JWN95_3361 [Frankiales bacterium]|nr:hypothetical protein [Frankiales bacterium]